MSRLCPAFPARLCLHIHTRERASRAVRGMVERDKAIITLKPVFFYLLRDQRSRSGWRPCPSSTSSCPPDPLRAGFSCSPGCSCCLGHPSAFCNPGPSRNPRRPFSSAFYSVAAAIFTWNSTFPSAAWSCAPPRSQKAAPFPLPPGAVSRSSQYRFLRAICFLPRLALLPRLSPFPCPACLRCIPD